MKLEHKRELFDTKSDDEPTKHTRKIEQNEDLAELREICLSQTRYGDKSKIQMLVKFDFGIIKKK